MTPGTRIALGLAYDAALLFLLIGSLFALAFGLALMFRPSGAMRFSELMNGWVSTRRALRAIEIPRDVQRHLYRQHRIVGLFAILGSGFTLYMLTVRYNAEPIVAYLTRHMRPGVASWYVEWFRWFVLVTNGFVFCIGVVMFIRPSLLKRLELWANRHVSGRPAGKTLEEMHMVVDRLVLSHPRISGGVITVGSAYVLTSLAVTLASALR